MKKFFLALVLGGACVAVFSGCASNDRGGDDSCGDLPACGEGLSCCAGMCVSTVINTAHCGFCGNACDPGQTCSMGMCSGMARDTGPIIRRDGGPIEPPGMCMPSCPSSQRCCGTTCVNREVPAGTDGRTDTSFENCGACGIMCDPMLASSCSRPPMGGTGPECRCGSFADCFPGEVCAMSGGMIRCISLRSDPENCGEIGRACAGDELCSMGNCVCGSTGAPCGPGTTCCGGSCIDTTSDPMNCGGCGMVCGAQGTGCRDSMCVCGDGPGCRPPAGMDSGQLCCADACVNQDPMNCGGCGVVCDGSECVTGMDFFSMSMRTCCGMMAFPGTIFCDTGGGMGFPDGGFGP